MNTTPSRKRKSKEK